MHHWLIDCPGDPKPGKEGAKSTRVTRLGSTLSFVLSISYFLSATLLQMFYIVPQKLRRRAKARDISARRGWATVWCRAWRKIGSVSKTRFPDKNNPPATGLL